MISQEHGAPQGFHLSSSIIDVVLSLHLMASCLKNIGEGISNRSSAAVSHMQGTGGVGTNELYLYVATVSNIRAAIALIEMVYFT